MQLIKSGERPRQERTSESDALTFRSIEKAESAGGRVQERTSESDEPCPRSKTETTAPIIKDCYTAPGLGGRAKRGGTLRRAWGHFKYLASLCEGYPINIRREHFNFGAFMPWQGYASDLQQGRRFGQRPKRFALKDAL